MKAKEKSCFKGPLSPGEPAPVRAKGAVVQSLCGRDKKRCFMIVEECDDGSDRVMLADGKLRKISSPKKKSLRHLAILAIAGEGQTSIPDGDEKLSEYLREFEENLKRKH